MFSRPTTCSKNFRSDQNPQKVQLWPTCMLFDRYGVAHSVNTHPECCCCWNTFYAPRGEEKHSSRHRGNDRFDTCHWGCCTVGCSFFVLVYFRQGGKKVVDIVLLLQQQHNNDIFTSFLTRRTLASLECGSFYSCCPLFSPPFSVLAVVCTLHLCKYSLWCWGRTLRSRWEHWRRKNI